MTVPLPLYHTGLWDGDDQRNVHVALHGGQLSPPKLLWQLHLLFGGKKASLARGRGWDGVEDKKEELP